MNCLTCLFVSPTLAYQLSNQELFRMFNDMGFISSFLLSCAVTIAVRNNSLTKDIFWTKKLLVRAYLHLYGQVVRIKLGKLKANATGKLLV